MAVTNDSQLVPPEETTKKNKGKRPLWVTAAVLVFLIFGLGGGCTSVQQIIQIGQIDWAGAAKQLDTEVNLLKWMTYLQTYGTLILSLVFLALCAGMWTMKKWGAVISLILGVIGVVVLVVIPFRKMVSVSLAEIIIFGFFVVIGVGQFFLWRKGELT